MLLVRASSLITMPILTRFLTKDEYGIISITNSIGAFLLTLFGMGSAEYILRHYWERDGENRKKLFGSFFLILMLFPLIVLVIPLTLFGKTLFGYLFSNVDFYPYIFFTIWTSWLLNLNILPYEFMKIREQSSKYTTIALSSTFSNILLTVILVVIYSYGAFGPILSKFILSIVFGIFFLYFTIKEINIFFSLRDVQSFFSYNSPLLVALICGSLLNHVDIIILQKYVPLHDVALYSVGVSIAGLIPFIVRAINLGWAPFFYENVFKSEKKESSQLVSFSIDYILLGVIFLITGIIMMRQEIILVLASNEYLSVSNIMIILIIGNFFISMRGFGSRGILVAGKNMYITYSSIVGVILNLCLNLYFIPKYGMYGAAYTTTFCSILMYTYLHLISQRFYMIDFHYLRIVKLIIAAIITVAIWHIFDFILFNFLFNYILLPGSFVFFLTKFFIKGIVLITLFPGFLLLSNYFYDNEKKFLNELISSKILRKKSSATD